MCRAVGTSNLHPEQLVLEGDDVAGTKLDLGDFENCGSKIVFTTVSIFLVGVMPKVETCQRQCQSSLIPPESVSQEDDS